MWDIHIYLLVHVSVYVCTYVCTYICVYACLFATRCVSCLPCARPCLPLTCQPTSWAALTRLSNLFLLATRFFTGSGEVTCWPTCLSCMSVILKDWFKLGCLPAMEGWGVLFQFANIWQPYIPDVTPLCQGEEVGEQFDIVRTVGCDYWVKMVGTSLPPSSEK